MGTWIKLEKRNRYKCSACQHEISTSYPVYRWIECPWCRDRKEEKNEDRDV